VASYLVKHSLIIHISEQIDKKDYLTLPQREKSTKSLDIVRESEDALVEKTVLLGRLSDGVRCGNLDNLDAFSYNVHKLVSKRITSRKQKRNN
jgi:hypothetical protein